MTANQIIDKLGLKPLPVEGGYYKETFRSDQLLSPQVLGADYSSDRLLYSSIYYLLTLDSFSALHQLPGDEIFHFYLGDTVEMLQLFPDGAVKVIEIGHDILNGVEPQVLVKGKTWQGCRLKEGGTFALMGTTMSPGFDVGDYVGGDVDELLGLYPNFREEILGFWGR